MTRRNDEQNDGEDFDDDEDEEDDDEFDDEDLEDDEEGERFICQFVSIFQCVVDEEAFENYYKTILDFSSNCSILTKVILLE